MRNSMIVWLFNWKTAKRKVSEITCFYQLSAHVGRWHMRTPKSLETRKKRNHNKFKWLSSNHLKLKEKNRKSQQQLHKNVLSIIKKFNHKNVPSKVLVFIVYKFSTLLISFFLAGFLSAPFMSCHIIDFSLCSAVINLCFRFGSKSTHNEKVKIWNEKESKRWQSNQDSKQKNLMKKTPDKSHRERTKHSWTRDVTEARASGNIFIVPAALKKSRVRFCFVSWGLHRNQ